MKTNPILLRTALILWSVNVFAAKPPGENPEATIFRFNAVVAVDGSGTHTNLQAAIAAAPDNGTDTFTILIKPGTYAGPFVVPKGKNHLKFIGEATESTILTGSLNQNEPSSAGGRALYNNASTVVLGDDFRAENLTFQNTSGDHGQALALRADGDRAVFNHCRLLGWQDTLLVNNGRYYFTNCYVEGRVDFIYGSATAVFDRCEIHSKNGGHVTAANTPKDRAIGFVFMNCKLTGDPQPWTSPAGMPANTNQPPLADLGRPWRPYASVTYLNCDLGAHIKPEGWNNWRNPTNELTARFGEYHSTGPGANPAGRVKWAKQLTDDEAQAVRRRLGPDAPIALVTSAWHMPRAIGLMRRAGLQPLPCPTDYLAQPNAEWRAADWACDLTGLERSTWAIYERLGTTWARWQGKI